MRETVDDESSIRGGSEGAQGDDDSNLGVVDSNNSLRKKLHNDISIVRLIMIQKLCDLLHDPVCIASGCSPEIKARTDSLQKLLSHVFHSPLFTMDYSLKGTREIYDYGRERCHHCYRAMENEDKVFLQQTDGLKEGGLVEERYTRVIPSNPRGFFRFKTKKKRRLPFKTCTRTLATSAFDGEHE